jgi:hypothetical protein
MDILLSELLRNHRDTEDAEAVEERGILLKSFKLVFCQYF